MTDFITTCIKRFKERHELSWTELAELTGIPVVNFYRLKAKGRFNKHPKFWPQLVRFLGPQFLRGADHPGDLQPQPVKEDPLLVPFLALHYADVRDPVSAQATDSSEIDALKRGLEEAKLKLEKQDALIMETSQLKKERDSLKLELKRTNDEIGRLTDAMSLLEKSKEKLKRTVTQLQRTIETLQNDL